MAGDTKGNIFLFDYTVTEGCEYVQGGIKYKAVMNYQYLKAHKNERVLSLQWCEDTQQLYSTSKDNFVNIYKFNPFPADDSSLSQDS